MPNKITYTVQTSSTSRQVEYWNPSTNTYQDANPLVNIPAGTYNGLKVRLKGSPVVEAFYPNSVIVTSDNSSSSYADSEYVSPDYIE